MKPTARLRLFLTGATAIAACSLNARAQFIKADNTTSLTTNGSWTTAGVPTSTGTITFDNTLSTTSKTANLGGNLSVLGISATATPVSSAARQWGIGNTAGATLTIGSGGIVKAANTSAFVISSAIALGASQTWTLNATTGTGTGNLQLNGTSFTDNGNTLAVNGGGTLDIRTTGSLTLGSAVTIDTSVSINGATATTDVTFGGSNTNNTLNIVAGKLSGSTIGNFGQASNFGDGGTNTAIVLGGGAVGQNGLMVYTGNTNSSNRTVSRDARSVASGIEVSTAGQTLTISGNLSSGNQVNALGSGWAFSGAGDLTLDGTISNSTGVGSFGTTITKSGGGTLTLGSGTNSYTGATAVKEGKLLIGTSGSLANTAVTVGGAGTTGAPTLGGGGTIGGATTIAAAGGGVVGTHSVGAVATGGATGVGKQTFSSSVTYETGSIFEWNLAATPSETGRGTSYDAVNAASLGSTTGAIFRVVLNDTQDFSEAFWNIDRTWSDIFKTGDAGSNLSIASIFSGTVQYYNGGGTTLASISAPTEEGAFTFDGSALKWTAVPEPTSALAGLLIAAGLLRRRRSA